MANPKAKVLSNTEAVNAFMDKLDHPLKREVQAVREIILNTHSGIKEQIKWNAPSFGYTDYIVTFNLRARDRVHLVFHNPHIASVKSEILEGEYVDRRMAYFSDMKDVKAKKAALEKVINELIRLMDEQ
jgi:uncharacterized protein YdeI (YjbR/CyaY-like superfamily)